MAKTHYIIPFFVPHWGCPHACVFCNQQSITKGYGKGPKAGENFRGDGEPGKEQEGVLAKIKAYFATMPQDPHRPGFPAPGLVVEAAFYGGSFTGIPRDRQEALLAPAREAMQKGLIHGIRVSTRPDYISEPVLDLLEDYGVTTIELGVQSLDQEVLHQANRGHSREDVYEAVELIKKREKAAGERTFKLGLQMMIGLPGDSPERSLATAREVAFLKPDFVRVYPTLVIRGTALEEQYSRGDYLPLTLDEAVTTCVRIVKVFRDWEIPVIRIGLQPTEEISEGCSVVAGPFHPAFRDLVEGELARERLEEILKGILIRSPELREVGWAVHPRDLSTFQGQGKRNLKDLETRYGVKIRLVQDADIERGIIRAL